MVLTRSKGVELALERYGGGAHPASSSTTETERLKFWAMGKRQIDLPRNVSLFSERGVRDNFRELMAPVRG